MNQRARFYIVKDHYTKAKEVVDLFRGLIFVMLMLITPMLALRCSVYPAKAAASLIILPTDSGYLNDFYDYYIVGEVQNEGSTPVTNVVVNATLYDSTGASIAEISQPTMLSTILPGRISPFGITFYSTALSQRVLNYTLHISQYLPTSNGQVGLMIVSNTSSLDSNGFHVSGTIRNIGTQNTTFVQVIATFYDKTGHAIAVVATYSDPSSLDVNQTAPFNMLLNSSAANQVDHFALEAESYDSNFIQDYELIPEFQPILFVSALLILTTTISLTLKRFPKEQCARYLSSYQHRTNSRPYTRAESQH